MEIDYIYIPIKTDPECRRVGFTRIPLVAATEADKLIVQQSKDYNRRLLIGEPITDETMIQQLKDYFEGKES